MRGWLKPEKHLNIQRGREIDVKFVVGREAITETSVCAEFA